MDTKGPISPFFQGNFYIFVIIDTISNFIATKTAPHISSYYDTLQF